jgi:hypothetical protein
MLAISKGSVPFHDFTLGARERGENRPIRRNEESAGAVAGWPAGAR